VATPWEGSLVEYVEDSVVKLALLCEPLDAHGRSWSAKTKEDNVVISLSAITFHWPRQYLGQSYRYGIEDVIRLGDLCTSLVSSYKDHIKIAWGNYVDRGVSRVTPDMLASFLFGSFPKPHELYVSHRLLSNEEAYFARDGVDETLKTSPLAFTPVFRCRTLQEVSKVERERKERILYRENLATFLRAVSLVMARSEKLEEKWKMPPYKCFIDKLVETALATDRPIDLELYKDVLKPLDVKQHPKAVFNLLVSLGIFKSYQNPNVLRYSRSLDITPEQEDMCNKVYVYKDLASTKPP
jgi:hypothetical protein